MLARSHLRSSSSVARALVSTTALSLATTRALHAAAARGSSNMARRPTAPLSVALRPMALLWTSPLGALAAARALAADSSGNANGSTTVLTPAPRTNISSDAPATGGTRGIKDTPGSSSSTGASANAGGQRYDLVAAVAAVAVVIIAALLFVLRRSNQRARRDRGDVYKSSSDNDDVQLQRSRASVSSMSSTWKVESTATQHRPRVSSPTLTTSVGGDKQHDDSDDGTGSSRTSESATLNAIWRDPVIAAARIPFDAIKMRSLLCRGAFGEVFEGTYRRERVAIKRLLPETRQHIENLEYFMLEVRMMASLRHARVVTFVGVAWGAMNDLCIVSELMAQGDLRNVLQKWKHRRDPTGWNATKLRMAQHIAEALAYLHALSPKLIIHRDLKSRNVLIDDAFGAKLSDFGVSREHSSQVTRTLTANIGSSLWMAPEVMLGENYDETADIFSFGIVLTELDTHALPYHGVTTPDGRRLPEPAVLHMVTMGTVQAEFSSASRPDVVALGRQCLSLDRSVRPSAAVLVERFRAMLADAEATPATAPSDAAAAAVVVVSV